MSRSHNHDNCTYSAAYCTSGVLTLLCEAENCFNEYCVDLGHCPCKCHSGKTCACGYQWERMLKSGS
jgi:hypothetical protein